MKMNVRVLVHRGYDSQTNKMLSANDLTALGVRLRPDGQWENLPEHILVMAFVMREDQDGTPVFENDILDVDIETEMGVIRARGVMGWDANQNGFHLKVQSQHAAQGIATNMRVIGNIFQHKDLLKEDAQLPA
jgi:hypothetical protein